MSSLNIFFSLMPRSQQNLYCEALSETLYYLKLIEDIYGVYLGWGGYCVLDDNEIRSRLKNSIVKSVDFSDYSNHSTFLSFFFNISEQPSSSPFLLPLFFSLVSSLLPHTLELVAWLLQIQILKNNENLKINK